MPIIVSMKDCPECKHKLAENASNCPKCGYSFFHKTRGIILIILGVILYSSSLMVRYVFPIPLIHPDVLLPIFYLGGLGCLFLGIYGFFKVISLKSRGIVLIIFGLIFFFSVPLFLLSIFRIVSGIGGLYLFFYGILWVNKK